MDVYRGVWYYERWVVNYIDVRKIGVVREVWLSWVGRYGWNERVRS